MEFEKKLSRIRQALSVLIKDGSTAELRVLDAENHPRVGLFADLDEMANAAARSSGASGVYVTLNPVKSSLKKEVKNCLGRAIRCVTDHDIESRRWLFMDFDPIRPGKSPSTEKNIRQRSNSQGSVVGDFALWDGQNRWLQIRVTAPIFSTALTYRMTLKSIST